MPKESKEFEQIEAHIKGLNPFNPPLRVKSKATVANWQNRVNVAKDFLENRERYRTGLSLRSYREKRKPDWNQNPSPLAQLGLKITAMGPTDGGTLASEFNQQGRHPILLIAANANHIGGSLYRVGANGTGDAQEEQAGNTYAGALAIASFPEACDGIRNGEICYSQAYKNLLHKRGALAVHNVPGIGGQLCDQILVAAPNLKQGQDCFKAGQFDPIEYASQMYELCTNEMQALADQDPRKPIILTLAGTGVFLGDDKKIQQQAKIIHALCLKKAMAEHASKLQGREFFLPYADELIYNLVFDKLDTIDAQTQAEIREIESHLKQASLSISPGIHTNISTNTTTSLEKKDSSNNAFFKVPKIQPIACYVVDNTHPQNPNKGQTEFALKFSSSAEKMAFLNQLKNKDMFRHHPFTEDVLIIKESPTKTKESAGVYNLNGDVGISFAGTNNSEEDQRLLAITVNSTGIDYKYEGKGNMHVLLSAQPDLTKKLKNK